MTHIEYSIVESITNMTTRDDYELIMNELNHQYDNARLTYADFSQLVSLCKRMKWLIGSKGGKMLLDTLKELAKAETQKDKKRVLRNLEKVGMDTFTATLLSKHLFVERKEQIDGKDNGENRTRDEAEGRSTGQNGDAENASESDH